MARLRAYMPCVRAFLFPGGPLRPGLPPDRALPSVASGANSTVLFADLKGSMDLGEKVDPEEWYRIMDRFFQILSDGVHRFEGTVDKFTGDGIMAIFGAPIAHEDHARRACYAALHLKEELRRYAEELKRTREISFAVRMGLNSGGVVVGTIGDDLKMVYTAHGNTVGLGQRSNDGKRGSTPLDRSSSSAAALP